MPHSEAFKPQTSTKIQARWAPIGVTLGETWEAMIKSLFINPFSERMREVQNV